MRVVWWLVAIFCGSIWLGFGCFIAAGYDPGADALFEGMLGLAMLVALTGAISSGILLLVIGPKVVMQLTSIERDRNTATKRNKPRCFRRGFCRMRPVSKDARR